MSPFLSRNYEVKEVTSEYLVEYRWHFSLYISREVKSTDIVHFEEVVKTVWSASHSSAAVKVSISHQEEVVDQRGASLWKLVVFIQNGTTFLDSSISPPINTTDVVSKLVEQNITGARGSYEVARIHSETVLQRYDYLFPLFLNTHVYEEDLVHICETLVTIWTSVFQEFYSSFHLEVKVVRQEDFISVSGENAAKLVYVLKTNDSVQSSTRLPKLSTTDIQTKLQVDLVTARYHVISRVESLVRYEQHFQLTLSKPVLQVDKVMFQTQLETAWAVSKNANKTEVKVTISKQEEITAVVQSESISLWRILYVVKYQGKLISARLETDVTNSSLHQNLNSTRQDEHVTYTDLIYIGDTSVFTVYKQLFVVHCEQKIAEVSYTSVSSSIQAAWKNSTGKSVSVKIVSQEKIYTLRKYVWKLTYTITEHGTVLRSDMIRGPDINTFRQHITSRSLYGKMYKFVDVEDELRLSYSLSIFLTSRIMLTFQNQFANTLKMIWTQSHAELALTDVKVEFQGYERFLDYEKSALWRHICFVSINGQVVNSAEYRRLNVTEVQDVLRRNMSYFPSDKYEVVDTVVDPSFKDYAMLYSVYFIGRPGPSLLHDLKGPVIASWYGKYYENATKDYNPEIIDRIEAVAPSGFTLTQVTYFMSIGSNHLDPLTIPPPSSHDIARNVNEPDVRAYAGNPALVREYNLSFWVNLRGRTTSLDSRKIVRSLTEIFTMADFLDVQVSLLKLEQYSGKYGVPVTKVLYTVRGNDTDLDPGLINNSIGSVIVVEDRENNWRVYNNVMYRLEVIYSFTLNKVLTKADKEKVETAITASFKDNRTDSTSCSSCNVSVSIVNGETCVSVEGVRLTRVAYTVQVDHMTLESWKNPQPDNEVLEQYLKVSDINYEIWTNASFSEESVYVLKSSNHTLDKVKSALSLAWGNFVNGTVNVKATEDKTYVDGDWNAVARIDYTVAVNETIPTRTIQNTSTGSHLMSALETEGVPMCKCVVRKLRRMYIKGEGANVTEGNLRNAILNSWLHHNPVFEHLNKNGELQRLVICYTCKHVGLGIPDISKSDLAVAIKPNARRRKRAAENIPKLVDKDGTKVTAVLYTVAVDGEEPQDLFVTAPSLETTDSQLKNTTGASLCNCTPSLSHTLRVAGNLTDKQKEAVKEAIKDALVAANPELKKDDLSVDIKSVNTGKDKNGNTVSDVEYTVNHKGGLPVEDLLTPSKEQMDSSLKKHGLSLPDNTKKESIPPNEDWKIIVGVVVGVGGFVVICAAIAYIYVHKKRQKAENLEKRKEGIRQNEFDKEHFSEPVNFNNPSFDANRHPLDPFSTRSL